jgi:hypothetical protein
VIPGDDTSLYSNSSSSSPEEDGRTLFVSRKETNPASDLEDSLYDITCLYEFSITIRNPAPRDRLGKCSPIDVSHFEPFDIQHVSHKSLNATKYLVERLGKANTRRRQLLRYHEKHHNKISGQPMNNSLPTFHETKNNTEQPEIREGQYAQYVATAVSAPAKGPETVATSRKSQTTISTYVSREQGTFDACSDTDHSQTSSASSAGSAGGQHII